MDKLKAWYYNKLKKIALWCLTKVLESKGSGIEKEDAYALLTLVVKSKRNKSDAQGLKQVSKAL